MPSRARLCTIVLALSLIAAPAAADAKKKKKPKPPTKTTITKLLAAAYCAPTVALNGNTIATVKVKLKSAKIAKARRGKSWLDGTPANRKTFVFPVRASYFCDYTATADANEGWVPEDLQMKGDYIFFRDEFGTWTHRNRGNTQRTVVGG